MNINDTETQKLAKNPRCITLLHVALVTIIPTSFCFIAETILKMYFDFTPLAVWAFLAIAGSLITAILRINAATLAIGTGLEDKTDGIMEALRPITFVIPITIIASASILIHQDHFEITTQQNAPWIKSLIDQAIPWIKSLKDNTTPWMESKPITTVAFTSSLAIAITNPKNLKHLLGKHTGTAGKVAIAMNIVITLAVIIAAISLIAKV